MVLADDKRGFRTLHLFAGAGGASLEICCSDTSASELSKSKATRGRSCSQGRRTEYFHASPSGMMSRLSLGIIRSVQNTSRSYVPSRGGSSSPVASPARTSPLREREPDSTASVRASGRRWPASLARWNRRTCSWRTAQCLLFEDSTECLETLPNWGMTRNGELWALTTPGRLTDARGSGSGGPGTSPRGGADLHPHSDGDGCDEGDEKVDHEG